MTNRHPDRPDGPKPLAAAELIELCERGQGLSQPEQALLLLEAASPDETPDRLAALPVGERDARLLALRARTLGPVLETETRCPACDERLELDVSNDDLLAPAAPSGERSSRLEVRHDGYEVGFRLPTSRDLLHARNGNDAERHLLARCVVEARTDGEAVAADTLPASVVEAVGAAMAEADPMADIRLALTCPACAHEWSTPLDPAAFFWSEIEAWVPRLLREVHTLASAYGWSERQILAMSAWRRGQYLQLLGSSP